MIVEFEDLMVRMLEVEGLIIASYLVWRALRK